MAKASKETVIVKPAQEAIAAKPAITEDVIHLQLSKEEAQALRTVLGSVGGPMYTSNREYCDNVLNSLQNLDINSDLESLRNIHDTINFKDWSEYKEPSPANVAEKQEFKFKLGERVWIPDWAEHGEIVEYPVDSCYQEGMYKVKVYFGDCGIYNFFESSLRKTSQES